MSYMFEIYYKSPPDSQRESDLTARVSNLGGRLSFREECGSGSICLTYEFDDLKRAESAAEQLRHSGEHVEGPVEYAA